MVLAPDVLVCDKARVFAQELGDRLVRARAEARIDGMAVDVGVLDDEVRADGDAIAPGPQLLGDMGLGVVRIEDDHAVRRGQQRFDLADGGLVSRATLNEPDARMPGQRPSRRAKLNVDADNDRFGRSAAQIEKGREVEDRPAKGDAGLDDELRPNAKDELLVKMQIERIG